VVLYSSLLELAGQASQVSVVAATSAE
jgi:hypothetical protein